MAFKRRAEPTTIEDERAALREQHAALEDLKRQLSERVEAVRDAGARAASRAIAEANGRRRRTAAPLPPTRRTAARPCFVDGREANSGEDALERSVASRRSPSASDDAAAEAALADATARSSADRRARETLERARARAETTAGARGDGRRPGAASPSRAGAGRRAARADRGPPRRAARRREDVSPHPRRARRAQRGGAARERLVAQKERELDDREDGVGQWASPELTEMEARLRRLEQQQDPSEQTNRLLGRAPQAAAGNDPAATGRLARNATL